MRSVLARFTRFCVEKIFVKNWVGGNDKYQVCQAISFSYWNDQITIAPTRQPVFQLDMVVDRSILLLGIAVFLPHGENIQGDVNIFVGASIKGSEETSREKVSLPKQVFLSG